MQIKKIHRLNSPKNADLTYLFETLQAYMRSCWMLEFTNDKFKTGIVTVKYVLPEPKNVVWKKKYK